MEYILNGFTSSLGLRVFTFEGSGADNAKTRYTVTADIDLIRKYGIRVQELPLLCRALLQARVPEQGPECRSFIYAEADMSMHASACATERDAAAQKRKAPRKAHPENSGSSWRGIQVQQDYVRNPVS